MVVAETSADQTTVVSIEEQTLETKDSKEEVEHNKEEVFEGKDDDDGNSQNKPDPEQDEKNQVDQVWSLRKDKLSPEAKKSNRSTYMMIGEETICLNVLYTLYPNQWLDNEAIEVYIKALIQYFDTQHRARPENERIVLANIFAYQYIGRAFNVWTRNMSSPKGVELKKKSI
ncbi:hypothetical protein GIB67_007393 [Kingdonia uniflora]|uniref:Uncharacterized protein n=1 Tax=Kingdonia uniflora TaxID=39325 RepID=A0A7J7MLI5_9MAGN|nr:hypothetical protein GIB67_007393 [Kingdonia uniflora]